MHSIDAILDVNGTSPSFLIVGHCDAVVSSLTSGAVKLQYKLPPSAVLPEPAWTDYPDGSYTANVYKTIFISEHGVQMRFVGVSNNANVYVRLARYLNKG